MPAGARGVQAVDAGIDNHVQDGHDVAVGVLDHVRTRLVGGVHAALEPGRMNSLKCRGDMSGEFLSA